MFHWYGLLIGIGVVAGFFVSVWQAKRHEFSVSFLDHALYWVSIPAVIGARLYHVLTDWHLYSSAPFWEILQIWNGGLGIFGAIFGGVCGLWIYVRYVVKRNLFFFFTILDLFSFGVPLAQAIGRIGNYLNKELYGLPSELPWAITIEGRTYHPLFLYEGLLNLCLLGILNWLGYTQKLRIGKGQYTFLYLFGYAFIRFWLEFLRIESARPNGVFALFSTAQWISIGILCLCSILFWVRRHAPKKEFDWSLE